MRAREMGAVGEGRHARLAGTPVTACPYREGRYTKRAAWIQGWERADAEVREKEFFGDLGNTCLGCGRALLSRPRGAKLISDRAVTCEGCAEKLPADALSHHCLVARIASCGCYLGEPRWVPEDAQVGCSIHAAVAVPRHAGPLAPALAPA